MELVGDHKVFVPLLFLVVVVGEELLAIVLLDHSKGKVEPQHIRFVLVDDFQDHPFPLVEELLAGLVLFWPAQFGRGVLVVQWTVQPGVLWISRVEFWIPMGEEPPVGGVVKSCQEAHSLAFEGGCLLSNHVSLGAHLGGVPLCVLAVPHRKPVVVDGDGASEASARFLEQLCPLVGIKLLPCEHWDEVLVAKLRKRTVRLDVMLVLFAFFPVDGVGIPGPIWPESWNSVDPPVGVYPELVIFEPFRRGMSSERLPVRFVRLVHDALS